MAIPKTFEKLSSDWKKKRTLYVKEKPGNSRVADLYRESRRFNSFREVEDDPLSLYNKLTEPQKQYVKNVVLRGLSVTDSIMDAYGITDQKEVQVLQGQLSRSLDVRAATGEMMQAVGIDSAMLGEVLKRGLNAEKIFYDKDNGVVNTGEHDHAVQHKFLVTALQISGAFDKPASLQEKPDEGETRIRENVKLEKNIVDVTSVLDESLPPQK